MRRLLFLPLVMLFWPALADAGTWCVPNASVSSNCPHVAPTVQAALAAMPPDGTHYIRLGPRANPSERLVITRSVRLICLPGALITDAGLAVSAGAMVQFAGPLKVAVIDRCRFEVGKSAVGIAVPHDAVGVRIEDSTLIRVGTRLGTGMRVDGSAGPPHALRASFHRSTVENFAIGLDFESAAWMNPEVFTARDNGIGVRCHNCKGQIFYGTFDSNDIGLQMLSIENLTVPRQGQIDINSNVFIGGQIGSEWRRCYARALEHNHNDYHDVTAPFRVQRGDGTWVTGDTAYREAFGETTQFADIRVCYGESCTTYDQNAFNVDENCGL